MAVACFSLNPRARPGPVPSTSTVAAPVVQVATLVGDPVALVAPACHPQGVACPHQGWTTDHPARPVPMVLMGVPTVDLMVAPTVALMVGLMAHMALLVHMDLQVVHTVIMVGHMVGPMVDRLVLMVPLAWALIMDPIKDPQEDLPHTTCRVSIGSGFVLVSLTTYCWGFETPGLPAPPSCDMSCR